MINNKEQQETFLILATFLGLAKETHVALIQNQMLRIELISPVAKPYLQPLRLIAI